MRKVSVENWASVEEWIVVATTAFTAVVLATFSLLVALGGTPEKDVSTQQTVSGVGYCTGNRRVVTVTVPVDCEAVCVGDTQ